MHWPRACAARGAAAPQLLLALSSCVAGKVVIHGFIESMCTDCKKWMNLQVQPVLADPALMKLVDIDLAAFGNANYIGIEPHCQHGGKECDANQAMNCAKNMMTNNMESVNFSICMMNSLDDVKVKDDMMKAVQTCGGSIGRAIGSCMYSTDGQLLTAFAAQSTLATKNTYSPWVVVDGAHAPEAETNLKDYICRKLPQSSRPSSCKAASLLRNDGEDDDVFGCPNIWTVHERVVPKLPGMEKLHKVQSVEVKTSGISPHAPHQ